MFRAMAPKHILPVWLYLDAGGEGAREVPSPGTLLYDRRIVHQLHDCFIAILVE